MRTLTGRRYAAAAATAVLLLSAAGCGNDDTDNASGEPTVATSSTEPSEPTGSSEPAGQEIDADQFAARLTSSFEQLTTAQVAMSIDVQGSIISATGQVDYSGDSAEMALKLKSASFGDGVIDMRLVDKVMYMSLPMVDASGKFYKIDLSDPDNPLGADLGDLTSFDPKSTFDMFTTGLLKVVELGEEDVDGDTTTHYQLTTDTEQIKKTLPKSQVKGFPDTLTYDVWLDADDRLRKMVADMPGAGELTMAMSHWGEPVDIKAPPPRLVATFPGQ